MNIQVTDREVTPEELERLKQKQLEAGKSYPNTPEGQAQRKGVHAPDVSVETTK